MKYIKYSMWPNALHRTMLISQKHGIKKESVRIIVNRCIVQWMVTLWIEWEEAKESTCANEDRRYALTKRTSGVKQKIYISAIFSFFLGIYSALAPHTRFKHMPHKYNQNITKAMDTMCVFLVFDVLSRCECVCLLLFFHFPCRCLFASRLFW